MNKKSNLKHKKGAIASLGLCTALALSMGVSTLQPTTASASSALPTSTAVAVTSVFQAHTKEGVKIADDARMDTRTHLLKSTRYYAGSGWTYDNSWDAVDPSVQGNAVMATLTGLNANNTTHYNRMQKTTKLDLSNNTQNDKLLKMDLALWPGGSGANIAFNSGWDVFSYRIEITDGTNSIVLFYVPDTPASCTNGKTLGYQPTEVGISSATNLPTNWPDQPDTTRAGLYVIANGQTTLGGLTLDGTFSGIGGTSGTHGDGYGSPIPSFTFKHSGGQHRAEHDEFKQVLYYDHEEKAIYADMWDGEKTVKKLVRDLDATGENNGNDTAWSGFTADPSQVEIKVTQKAKGAANAMCFAVYTLDGVDLDYDPYFTGALNGGTDTNALGQLADDESEPLTFDGYMLNTDGTFAGNSLYKNTGKKWYATRGVEVDIPDTFTEKATGDEKPLTVAGAYLEDASGTIVAGAVNGNKVTVPVEGEYTLVVFGRENGATSGPVNFTRRAVVKETYDTVTSMDATTIFQTYDRYGNKAEATLMSKKTVDNVDTYTRGDWTYGVSVGTFQNIGGYTAGSYKLEGDYYADGKLKADYDGKTLFLPLSNYATNGSAPGIDTDLENGIAGEAGRTYSNHVVRSTALNLADNTAEQAVLDIDLASYLWNTMTTGQPIEGVYRIRLTDGIKFIDLYYRAPYSKATGTNTSYYRPSDTIKGYTANWGDPNTNDYGELFAITSDATTLPEVIQVPAFTEASNNSSISCVSENRQKIYYDAEAKQLYVNGLNGKVEVPLNGWSFVDDSNVQIEITYKGGEEARFNYYSCIAHAVDGMEIAYESNKVPTLKGNYAIHKDGTFAGYSNHALVGADIAVTQAEAAPILTDSKIDGMTTLKAKIDGYDGEVTDAMIFNEVKDYTLTVWATKAGADDIVYVQTRTIKVAQNKNKYDVTFDANGVTADMPEAQQVQYGNYVTLPDPAPTNADKTFVGWYKDADGTNEWAFTTDVVTQNTTLYAKWVDKLMVTFNADGGECATASVKVDNGGKITLPTATRAGHELVGWFTAEDEQWNEADPVTATMTLTAKWTVNTYTVTFDSQDGSAVPSKTDVAYDTVLENLPTPEKAGYTFEGWLLNGEAYTNQKVQSDITLVASWKIDEENTFIQGVQMDVGDGFVLNVTISKGENVSYKINGVEMGELIPEEKNSVWTVSLSLDAKQITDEITFKVGDNGVEFTYSVLDYLESIADHATYGAVAKALIVYADAAQREFEYSVNGYAKDITSVNLDATEEAIDAQEKPEGNELTTTNTDDNKTYAGNSLKCDARLSIVVGFQGLGDGAIVTIGADTTPVELNTTLINGATVVVIDSVKVKTLDTEYTVNVNTGTYTYTLTLSALTYLQGNWANEKATVSNLCKALYYVHTLAKTL